VCVSVCVSQYVCGSQCGFVSLSVCLTQCCGAENGIIIVNSDPEAFESALKDITRPTLEKPYDDRLVFINAWNEWAEGNHLEPDLRYGVKYLEAVKSVNTIYTP